MNIQGSKFAIRASRKAYIIFALKKISIFCSTLKLLIICIAFPFKAFSQHGDEGGGGDMVQRSYSLNFIVHVLALRTK